ncbi:hypothetical protein [Flavobacterium sp.]|uniref:hypothetical protein n=1 Tax=Flavobacterium sp. TaxID=239 RepID=UPI0040473B67
MARKKMLKISPHKLHKVLKHLRELESNNPQLSIENKVMSEFLLEATEFETSTATIEIEVKIAILEVDGDNNPDPNTLSNTDEMADFGFSDTLYIRLTKRFTEIAKKRNPQAKLNPVDVKACETVGECVELVTEAAKP